jgi:hypothetical protein
MSGSLLPNHGKELINYGEFGMTNAGCPQRRAVDRERPALPAGIFW